MNCLAVEEWDRILVQDTNVFTSQSFRGCHSLGWAFKINCKLSLYHNKYVICEQHTYRTTLGKKSTSERFWYIQGLEQYAFNTPVELIEHYKLNQQPPLPPKEPVVTVKAKIIELKTKVDNIKIKET